MYTREIGDYLIISIHNINNLDLSQVLSVDKDSDAVIFTGLLIDENNQIIPNFRSFPNLLDLFLKRFSFLRKIFPQRMRKYLLWDISLQSPTMVDWVTSDLLFIRKDYYNKYLKQYDFSKPLSDMYACLECYKKGKQVYIFPDLRFVLPRKFKSNTFAKIKGFLRFLFRSISMYKNVLYPSRKYQIKKNLVTGAHKLNNRSFLKKIGANFQKKNKVVQVYEGKVSGQVNYKQPLIFSNDSVVGLVVNSRKEIGLITIWRHSPLKVDRRNVFPIFPDTIDLGIYSIEACRGGVEKSDLNSKDSILRELYEEINLNTNDILDCKRLSKLISNTAWDVFATQVFIFEVSDEFVPKLQSEEYITDFKFYTLEEVKKLIQENKIVCSITQSAILQYLTLEN